MNPARGLSTAALCTILLVLPFEPRRPTLPLLGLELTLLECVAAAATVVLLLAHRDRLSALVRRPPAPLIFLWSYAAAHALSAAVAPTNRFLAAKFALRMAAAAVFALAVAVAPREVHRRSFPALTVACSVVAVLAILEGAGATALDPLLDRFRPGPYTIGTWRRGSAGSENPNLAATFLIYGLVPAVGGAALRRRPEAIVIPLTALFALGVIFTYSRGGLVALAIAVTTLWAALAVGRRAPARAPASAALTLLVVTGIFAAFGGAFRLRLVPEGLAGGHAARYETGAAFLSLRPGELRRVPVTITNTGGRAWTAGVLGCSWQSAGAERAIDLPATFRCPATTLPRAVAPGASVMLEVPVRAPTGEGRYLLVWDLVADGWVFSSLGVAPGTVPAAVGESPDRAEPFTYPVPPGAQRGRTALWRLAIALWREHPLFGVGPDNFRWVHAAYAGWPRGGFQDTLIPANNLFLEAAATTGTLGLLTLLGTFVTTARSALRCLSAAPRGSPDAAWSAVLLALTVGIAVHGIVDSFLGFTGHYLFLGLVVGEVSSASAGKRETNPI